MIAEEESFSVAIEERKLFLEAVMSQLSSVEAPGR